MTGKIRDMKHVKAVIFDWAGTVVDYGSLAPMGAFVETFAEFGVAISIDEARGPMGGSKGCGGMNRPAPARLQDCWVHRWKIAHRNSQVQR